MRPKHICITLALALLATATTAEAADWNNGAGGLKDSRAAGVPVPAPIPVAETFKWYLRVDAGLGLARGGDVTESGMQYGLIDGDPATTPFGMSSSWFNNGFDTFAMGGVGVGAYLSPRMRADVTIDARTKADTTASGSYSYFGNPAIFGATPVEIHGRTVEKIDIRSTVALANLYYDLGNRGGLSPYVGVGAGFAVRSLDREHATHEIAYDTTGGVYTTMFTRDWGARSKAHQVAPAAAVTAGVNYALSPGMVLDFNYRFTYIGAVDTPTNISLGSGYTVASRISVADTFEHALRAGVRWNVW